MDAQSQNAVSDATNSSWSIINASFNYSDFTLVFSINLLLITLVAVVVFLVFRAYYRHAATIEMELEIPHVGKVKIVPDYKDRQLAHQMWVEFTTRKAGLPFEEDNDVIEEVYNSWYELFRITRNHIKEIQAHRISHSSSTAELVRVSIAMLNEGMRPHLTKWQARFRSWYTGQSESKKTQSPQEIQREFPHYLELVEDLKKVNGWLVAYTEMLRKIAQGK